MSDDKRTITNCEQCRDCLWAKKTKDFRYTDMYECTFQLPPWAVDRAPHQRLVSPWQTCSFHSSLIKELSNG